MLKSFYFIPSMDICRIALPLLMISCLLETLCVLMIYQVVIKSGHNHPCPNYKVQRWKRLWMPLLCNTKRREPLSWPARSATFLFLDDLENTAIPSAGNLDFERKAGKLEQKNCTKSRAVGRYENLGVVGKYNMPPPAPSPSAWYRVK